MAVRTAGVVLGHSPTCRPDTIPHLSRPLGVSRSKPSRNDRNPIRRSISSSRSSSRRSGTERGERNARSLGERLRGLTFAKVFTSPLGFELPHRRGGADRSRNGRSPRRPDPGTMAAEYKDLATDSARIHLIDHGPRVLGAFSEGAHAYAAKVLQDLGVHLRLGTSVKEIGPGTSCYRTALPSRPGSWSGEGASRRRRWPALPGSRRGTADGSMCSPTSRWLISPASPCSAT
jgi:hypothetical protein